MNGCGIASWTVTTVSPQLMCVQNLSIADKKNGGRPVHRCVKVLRTAYATGYRCWCAHCVRGRERNDPHRSGGGRRGPRDDPHFAIDCGFLKASDPDDPADQESKPILIGAEAKYGLTLVMAIPSKGNAAPWIAKRVADWLDRTISVATFRSSLFCA